jgi:hypothetical protein
MCLNIDRFVACVNDLQDAAVVLFKDIPTNHDFSGSKTRGVKRDVHDISANLSELSLKNPFLVAGSYHEGAKDGIGPNRLAPSIPEGDLRSGGITSQRLPVELNC